MSDYGPGPHVAVDAVVIHISDIGLLSVLLIKRKDGTWALPGGFVDPDDSSLYEACIRELNEETGLSLVSGEPLRPMTSKNRDPRSWVISFPFLFGISGRKPKIEGMDDATDARWFDLGIALEMELFLDHHHILNSVPYGKFS